MLGCLGFVYKLNDLHFQNDGMLDSSGSCVDKNASRVGFALVYY